MSSCGARTQGDRVLQWVTIALLLLGGAPGAWSQEGSSTSRDLPGVRLSAPPEIDGDLSDPVWQEAAKAERFVDWLNGNANIDQTVVYLGYDDENLYVGWYA